VTNPFDVKENDEHALDFAFHLSRLFWCGLNRACHSDTHVWFMLSSLNTCLIIIRVPVVLFLRFAQNLM
jgi:hypothetical protein